MSRRSGSEVPGDRRGRRHPGGPGGPGGPDDRGDDHLGLFDDSDPAGSGAADGPGDDGEVDLTELREALARRQASDEPAADPADGPAAGGDAPDSARRHSRTAARREERARERRRRTRRVRSSIIALLVMALIAASVVVGVVVWNRSGRQPTDWAGTGPTVVVVRVQNGDGLTDVADTLAAAGVVANAKTFVKVASGDAAIKRLQPGYYTVHEHSASQVVVDELTDPRSRVGQMRVIPGETLADVTKVSTTGVRTVRPGILSSIVKACLPTDGAKACFSVDDLQKVAETASLSDLGIPGWAMQGVEHAPDPHRRLEGLILPGNYDIAPGSTAEQAMEYVVQASAAQWSTTGIVATAEAQKVTPYQLTIIASLVQSEGLAPDMPKISRVIYNRLHDGIMLQFDSTVNYALDRAQIATSDADRANPSPYNTYAHQGLPPTPIGSPGPAALDAAGEPADGSWLYFVAVDTKGNTCFSTTAAEHEACVAQARANGVFG